MNKKQLLQEWLKNGEITPAEIAETAYQNCCINQLKLHLDKLSLPMQNIVDLYSVQVIAEDEHRYVGILIGLDQFFVRFAFDGEGEFYDLYDQDKNHLDEIWCGGSIDFDEAIEDLKQSTRFQTMIQRIVDFIY